MSSFLGSCPSVLGKFYVANITGGSACGDSDNAAEWLAANDPSPGWPAEPTGWEIAWSAAWDSPSDTDPDPTTVFGPNGSVLPGGSEYPAASNCTPSLASMSKFLLPVSTLYIIGEWCSSGSETPIYQSFCVMSGTPTRTCGVAPGYEFTVPIPPSINCNTDCGGGQVTYQIATPIPLPFMPATWPDYVSYCTANPTLCVGFSETPSSCDFGDDDP